MSNLKVNVVCDKSIILSNKEGSSQTVYGTAGQLRFNQNTLKFEGYHSYPNSNTGADIFGNNWRSLTQDVASVDNLGIIRVGSNLNMQASTGILSSVAAGVSRIYQCVITISPIDGAADYQSINEAISHAIGSPLDTPTPYTYGFITSNLGGPGIPAPPSPLNPFLIQLGPGEYTESLNQIILPDYVSLRGEDNYNSVITQNAGSNISNLLGSMIIVGQNSEVKNVVINLADTQSSAYSYGIWSLNKSNVVIDNCIITCSSNISTNSQTCGILINNGNNNSITNNKIIFNSSTLTGDVISINITNTTTKIINNNINILTPNTSQTYGVYLSSTTGSELASITDKTYIENLILSINYYNTVSGGTNTGIISYFSSIIIKNSEIEVSNTTNLSTNYGIVFEGGIGEPPYGGILSNVIIFTNTKSNSNPPEFTNTINSSNIAVVNFLTQNYSIGQYLSVSGSSLNNGVYKIASVPSSNVIVLENGYNLVNEDTTIANFNVMIKALFDINIYNTKINASTNTIKNLNSFNNSNIVNLNNVITEGGPYKISPSYVVYTNYKTITVGKANCDYTSLYNAMNSITDNSINTRYLIKIQSGIYYEKTYIVCKQYVDIEGNGEDNTILEFSQTDDYIDIDHQINACCILLSSNISIKKLRINNNYINLYKFLSLVILSIENTNVTLENIIINNNLSTYDSAGMWFRDSNTITLRNINIYSSNSTYGGSNRTIGIRMINITTMSLYNVSILTNSVTSNGNYNISMENSECNIYNSTLIANSALLNYGIYTVNTNNIQKLIQIYNGQIRAYNNTEYSIYADDYYTIMCNGLQLLGDTFANAISSKIYCNCCYTFPNENNKTNIQSLNSRGQNEQNQNTITIGDSAGKRNATGNDNVYIGVNSGANVSTDYNNTFLGSNTGSVLSGTNNNTLLGAFTGEKITSGSYNTITGAFGGSKLTNGFSNTITGESAGYYMTTAKLNSIFGTRSGYHLTSGNYNTFMGYGAGFLSNIAINNTFIGYQSGDRNAIGNNNTYLGNLTGQQNSIGNNNVLIGNESGYNNTSDNIVAVGTQSGYNNNASIKNTYIGHNSGYNNTTGCCNTYLGHKSGYSSSSIPPSGSYNIAIGNEAGYSVTSASRNVLIGSTKSLSGSSNDAAGWSLQDGTDNIHIGTNAGANATSTINNVIIGSDVGTSITTSGNNVLIGKNTGNAINTIGGNIIIGTESGNNNSYGNAIIVGQNAGVGYTGQIAYTIGNNAGKNVQGKNNMFIGQNSGGSTTIKSGNYNLAIGPYSGNNLTSGSRNVLIGSGDSIKSVGIVISTGSDNTLLGYSAGSQISGGNNNTLIGSNAGVNLTIGVNNLILGYSSAYYLNQGSDNVSLGPFSGYNLIGGSGNIYTGYKAGYNTKEGQNNINIGYEAGFSGIDNQYANNIHIGYQTGYYSTASNNLFLGYQTGLKNTTGVNNIFMGSYSGQGNNVNNRQIGDSNIFIGPYTGNQNDSGYNNIFLGNQAGQKNIGGSKNIYIGQNTGLNCNLSQNIFIGTSNDPAKGIGYNSQTIGPKIGNKNVFIGHDVGIDNTSGGGNIFLGDSAGSKNTTGLQNIYIGKNTGSQANTVSANYNIAIGYYAGYANTSGYENILIGTEAGKFLNESNQIFIGTRAGASTTTGNNNIFIGYSAGSQVTTQQRNVVIGYNAMRSGTSNNNVMIGNETGTINNGDNNVFIGNLSGHYNNTGISNTFIGSATGGNNDSGYGNIFMGTASGLINSSGSLNTFMGFNSGRMNTNGSANIFMGYESGYLNQYGGDNIFMGTSSGYNSNSSYNTFIGGYSGYNNVYGEANLYIGYQSGNNSVFGNANLCMGYQSGYMNQSNYNTFIGFRTGYNNDRSNVDVNYGDHSYNTYIGNLVGQLNNGYNNFFLGYEEVDNILSAGSLTYYNNKFAIYNNSQNGITSNTSGTCKILIGGDFSSGTVGIGTLIPDTYGAISETATKLVVVGSVKANSYSPFTGVHEVNIDSTINNPQTQLIEGMIMTSTGVVKYQDINNTVVTTKPSLSTNDKAVYGVYSRYETVKVENSNSTITTYYVNSLGEGGILVSNYGGEIQNGDYITTCPIGDGGYGSLQSDDIMHSYTVAKCTQNVDWSSITTTLTYNDITYKYTMVSCTYHCG